MKSGGKWEEYTIERLFSIQTPKKKFNANKLTFNGNYPYVARGSNNNGIKGYIDEDELYLNPGNTISFGQDTATMFYQENAYFTGDKIKIFSLRHGELNSRIAVFLISAMKKSFSTFSWGSSSFNENVLNKVKINIPTFNNVPAYNYMVKYIEELEAAHIEELEAAHIEELEAYLLVSGLADSRTRGLADSRTRGLISYELTPQEYNAIELLNSNNLMWGTYNLKKLFGPAIRGKRLKNADRIPGSLPFVTAGEGNEGISAFISNDVVVFPENTITIDMFGSAKYRNYEYGADDHVAVVHTEFFDRNAVIFITASIHKSSCTGKFNYGRNFYAKDADELMVSLPSKDNNPDYSFMETLILAVHKLVIKDVVQYTDKKLVAYRQITSEKVV
ncbi:TPA: restriction endonuclease subunit S [Escherichia coli]|uniref:restriction endonuclease subunit S n=1 Tax=Escherichia coli TaxID=562 RepID=UPI001853C4E6|nr:restriction endonuclease subunit S [Escherichia coli]EFM3596186.1 restriction endonuclease [Escherichia coli]EGL6942723.1 restriction endonuclease [Escherichia coli]MCX8355792.1 restriction endonuclease subunit S [Escherichia coli]HBB2286664.1 restriction endonuclease [Escherichia coli]